MGTGIFIFVYMSVALLMAGIGLSQLKSKTPVAFYSGEKPFDAKELSDVVLWNKKHALMWIGYGAVIALSVAVGMIIGLDSPWSLVPLLGGLIVPVAVMVWYHRRLIKLYKR